MWRMYEHRSIRPRPFSRLGSGCALVLLGGLGLSLAGCNADTSLARSFGQGSSGTPANELRVGSRPPLSLPPEFTMRPERPGVVRSIPASPAPGQASASAAPRPGGGTVTGGRPSAGQSALVDAAGPSAAPDIRTRVNEDAQMETPEQGFTDNLLSWQRPADQPPVIVRGSSGSGSFLSRLF
jgi:hypothetical protein